METDELLELTVDEQKDELENLDLDQLKELREAEERNTAVDNIDVAMKARDTPEPEGDIVQKPEPKKDGESNETPKTDLETLEKKVDYIISRCKTTSQEGFEEYEN